MKANSCYHRYLAYKRHLSSQSDFVSAMQWIGSDIDLLPEHHCCQWVRRLGWRGVDLVTWWVWGEGWEHLVTRYMVSLWWGRLRFSYTHTCTCTYTFSLTKSNWCFFFKFDSFKIYPSAQNKLYEVKYRSHLNVASWGISPLSSSWQFFVILYCLNITLMKIFF